MKIYFKNYKNLTYEEKVHILDIRNLEYIRKNMYNSDVIQLENHLNWVNNLQDRSDCIYWAIYVDEELLGSIDITSINWDEKFAEWGFYINNKYFGFGVLIEYLGTIHFLEEMKFDKILACVFEENESVYKMHKNKFNYVDSPEHSFVKDSKKYNGLILTQENWYQKKQIIEKMLTKIYKIDEVRWE